MDTQKPGSIERRALWLAAAGFVLLLLDVPLRAQFTAAEIAERPSWEAYLKKATIVSAERLSYEEGVTRPWRLSLRRGGIDRGAVWKNASGIMGKYLEGWKYEIAAYLMDKLLGIGMVPPTVEKEFSGNAGSCQLWIEDVNLYKDLVSEEVHRERFRSEAWKKAGYIAQFFDNLIGNEDRHLGNVLVTSNYRAILIDHSRTFRTTERFVKDIPFSERNVPPEDLMRKLPRSLVQATSLLGEDEIRRTLGRLLTEEEIQAVLARRQLLLLEVKRIIERFGESEVLY